MFKSILVDVDATAAVHPALARATDLARRCGARLKIVDVLNIPAEARRHLPHVFERALVEEHRNRLEAFARATEDVHPDVEVLQGRPSVALVQEVLRAGHDLLIRSHARDVAMPTPKAYGAVDMELFRQCPCPVWAVGPGTRTPPLSILAAVHSNPDDHDEQALNVKLTDLALTMARLEGASLVLCQAWTAFGEDLLRRRYTARELSDYVQAAERTARSSLDHLVRSLGDRLAGVRVELRKGFAEDVIPQFAVSEGIDLVVLGTVARTGVAGLVIGNTAERLLQRLPCSVLAVKPDGFVSPIRLDAPP